MSDLRSLRWSEEGRNWPLREHSRFLVAGGVRWHVQVLGDGPVLLLIHGSGAATHTWRGLAPRLAERFTVVAPDLPGHGFSSVPTVSQQTMRGFACGLGALLDALATGPPLALVGHSAGAAVAARLALDGIVQPQRLVALSAALLPLPGLPGLLFGPAARLLAGRMTLARLVAVQGRQASAVRRLLDSSGSRIDAEGLRLYQCLLSNPVHVSNVLKTMANWDLGGLVRELPALPCPITLIHGAADAMIPVREVDRLRRRLPAFESRILPGLGHLAHEEAPDRVATELIDLLGRGAG